MKELLIQHGLITEEDLKRKFRVEIYAKTISTDVPILVAKYDGERFSVSNYQFKKIQHTVTGLKVVYERK